jgi:UPF0716 protein FxsA
MWLLILFVAIPLIEIALFIQVGGWLTLWPTLAIVVLTAVLGTVLVRQQGLRVLRDAQQALEELRDPLAPLAHGAMILLAGALLLTPGFLTDTMGLLLLVPAVRLALLRWALRNRVHVSVFGASVRSHAPARQPGGVEDVIDADFRDVAAQDPDRGLPRRPTDRPSPWSGERH